MKRILSLFFVALLCGTLFVNAQSQLSDGATVAIGNSQMTTNFLRAGDIPELLRGTITYDPAAHVLTLNDVRIQTTTSALYGMGIGCTDMPAGSKQIEVRIIGTNYIVSSKEDSYGLFLGDGNFVITGLNGTLKLMTNSGTALMLGCENLTVKEGAYVHAGYSETGLQTRVGASPALMSSPVVNVDCATLVSYGKEYTMAAINPDLTNAVEQDGYKYSSAKNAWTEADGTTILKNKVLTFRPTKHIFWWMNAAPEGGTVTVTKGGNPLPCPYYYDDSEAGELVDIVATANTDWTFGKWNNYNGFVDDMEAASTKYELPNFQTGLLIATFHYAKPKTPSMPWYMLNNFGDQLVKYTDLTGNATMVIDDLSKTGIAKVAVTQATFAQDKLYYLDQVDNTNVCMYSATFDPDAASPENRIKNPQVVVPSQNVYQRFYALTYNPADKHFYAAAKKSDATQYLIKIAADESAFTEVGPIEHSDLNNSVGIYLMAANKQGKLYAIFRSAELYSKENSPYRRGSMFCEIDPSTAAVTNIGWTGLTFDSNACAMAFDYKTGDLIGTNENGFDKNILSIDIATGRATRLGKFVAFNNGFFQMQNAEEAIDKVENHLPDTGSRKVLHHGCLYIINDGKTYNAQGQLIKQ